MNHPTEEFARLKGMHERAVLLKEGSRPIALLSNFVFVVENRTETMDLLLVPFEHSGYITRLFFERKINGRGRNWTRHRVVDRNWWAPSWNNVSANLPWPAMLCEHLRAIA